ncbi:MAG: hypothetical protein ACO1RX_16595 [Candidatus Sericytochromatia bacterium]
MSPSLPPPYRLVWPPKPDAHRMSLSLWPLVLAALWLLRQGLLGLAQWAATRDQLSRALSLRCGALLLWPFSAAVWTQLGNTLGDLGRWFLAGRCFHIALRLRPDWIEAWLGEGLSALVVRDDPAAAQAALAEAYRLRRGAALRLPEPTPRHPLPHTEQPPDPVKLRHDAEQLHWRVAQGQLDACWLREATAYEQAAAASEPPVPTSYNRPLWTPATPQLEKLLAPCDAESLTAQYYSKPGLVWYDGLLQPKALQALYAYCLASSAWHHVHSGGYLGAYLDDGLHDPLIFQLAQELRTRFVELLGPLKLVYAWAFQCRQQAPGVGLHHDSAVVNVNFWLTPDSANRNAHSGGITVCLKEPPLAWNLERYRVSPAHMRDFVSQPDAPMYSVPYRQNRVVIFHSRYFHQTQPFDFAPGYAEQRLNLTLLFGHQPLRYHPKLPLPPQLERAP